MARPGPLSFNLLFLPWMMKAQTMLLPAYVQAKWFPWNNGKVSLQSGLVRLDWYCFVLICCTLLPVISDQPAASRTEANDSQACLSGQKQEIWNVLIELDVPFQVERASVLLGFATIWTPRKASLDDLGLLSFKDIPSCHGHRRGKKMGLRNVY